VPLPAPGGPNRMSRMVSSAARCVFSN